MDVSNAVDRLKSYAKIKTDFALAEYLGVSHSTVASWKKRNTIDFMLIIDKFPEISFDWLFDIKNEEPQEIKQKVEENVGEVTTSPMVMVPRLESMTIEQMRKWKKEASELNEKIEKILNSVEG